MAANQCQKALGVRNFNYAAVRYDHRGPGVVPHRFLARARIIGERRALLAPIPPAIARLLNPCWSVVPHAPMLVVLVACAPALPSPFS